MSTRPRDRDRDDEPDSKDLSYLPKLLAECDTVEEAIEERRKRRREGE